MAQNLSFNQSGHLNDINEGNDNQEYKITNEIYEASVGEEVDCNLQTPLMFSRCSSLGSLTGFEQHSIQDDWNSVISEFSPKTSRSASPPAFSQNQTEIPCKLYSSHKINTQEKIFCDSAFVERKTIPGERISIYTNVSFQYDVAFKKPHFLKHSVFEDDIAAFKDESSNPLSTAASSLSSLTIEDDDYNDNSLSNKAGLVKKRINSINILQNTHYQEYCRRDPLGSPCESEQIAKANIKKVINQLNHKSMIHPDEKFVAQRNFNKGALIYEEPKFTWNLKTNQYSSNLQDISLKKDRNDLIKNESQCPVSKKDKFINNLQNNEESFMCHKIQPEAEHNDKHNKDDTYEKYKNEKLEFKEKRKVFEDCHKSNNEQSNYVEENNDLNAYEEQLLDQCIRRGMAKVTKQKITDIKPFCWDLNHICLTTRAMLKIHDEEIIRDRKDERSKRRISHKCLPIRYATDSRTK